MDAVSLSGPLLPAFRPLQVVKAQTRRQHPSPPLSCKGLKAGSKGPDKETASISPNIQQGLKAGSRDPDKETASISPNILQGLKAGSRDPDKETASISPIILRRPERR